MSTLLSERVHCGHYALCKAITALAARACGLLAPHHKCSQFAFGMVVCRGDALDEGVSEQCVAVGEQIGARAADLAQTQIDPVLKMADKDRFEPGDKRLQAFACLDAVAHAMPLDEMSMREQEGKEIGYVIET